MSGPSANGREQDEDRRKRYCALGYEYNQGQVSDKEIRGAPTYHRANFLRSCGVFGEKHDTLNFDEKDCPAIAEAHWLRDGITRAKCTNREIVLVPVKVAIRCFAVVRRTLQVENSHQEIAIAVRVECRGPGL